MENFPNDIVSFEQEEVAFAGVASQEEEEEEAEEEEDILKVGLGRL